MACDWSDEPDEYIHVPELYRITGVAVRGVSTRPAEPKGPRVLTDSISREFRFSVGGRGRTESFGSCNWYPCYPQVEVVNPAFRVAITLDTTLTLDGRDLASETDIAAALGIDELHLLTGQCVFIGPSPRCSYAFDPERVYMPDGSRTLRVTWTTEGSAETFTDSTTVEWRRLGF